MSIKGSGSSYQVIMLGFLASVQFDESKIWNYASVAVFEETGCFIKLHRGKIFDPVLIAEARKLEVGDQVYFQIQDNSRGKRRYKQFLELKRKTFTSCDRCGMAKQEGHELLCAPDYSQRLEGEFKVIEVNREEYGGVKLVLKGGHIQFGCVKWNNGPFAAEEFKVGDTAIVCGWRTVTRLTLLRTLYKKVEEEASKDEESLHSK